MCMYICTCTCTCIHICIQVRVRCSTKNEHTLIDVHEPSTHSYMLTFASPLACELGCAYAWAPSLQE